MCINCTNIFNINANKREIFARASRTCVTENSLVQPKKINIHNSIREIKKKTMPAVAVRVYVKCQVEIKGVAAENIKISAVD